MKVPPLPPQAWLIGAAALAVLFLSANSRSAAKAAVEGAAAAVGGAVQGIADAANDAINNATKTATNGQETTGGGWLWSILHPEEADALRYGLRLDGKPDYPTDHPKYTPPSLINY